ncbi:hypothetical protein IAE51_11030 [Lactococcus sp. S64]|uniref:hypothetical protein n=1 Tax=Lactococcus sp. S64 TaxID=2767459 RepID=UPI00190888C7|nr:hypothetical protein [Lactococcus sp. S64]MBK0084426.1 hypothetical protein [Lactococcus sp. S64]
MNQLSIIFLITLLMIFSIVTAVIFIIKHKLNTKGKYQLYWTTQKNLFSIKVNKGQFFVKADNLELAKKVGAKALQEKYKNKEWFGDIRFTVRGGGEKSLLSQENWEILVDLL